MADELVRYTPTGIGLMTTHDDGSWCRYTAAQAHITEMTDDRDSWLQQADSRTADALEFARQHDEARARITELEAERDEIRANADRYLWLRDKADALDWHQLAETEAHFCDVYIDSGRAATDGGEKL